MDIVKSVLQKLKNKSKKLGLSFQLVLQLFCQEEFMKKNTLDQVELLSSAEQYIVKWKDFYNKYN